MFPESKNFPVDSLLYVINRRILPHRQKIKHAPAGRLFYGSVGRMRTPVRQQVDLTSATQSNRHGCPAAGAPVPCEGIPPHPPENKTRPSGAFFINAQCRCREIAMQYIPRLSDGGIASRIFLYTTGKCGQCRPGRAHRPVGARPVIHDRVFRNQPN